ncbi:isopropylmalate synthase [Salinarimonas ramus]|uniref:2-isopropylmalate synthase n=1 Tax=Salinarimonas ramus TaxID=690164 RepID=A0A917QCZ3_9HYPH|nr:isopropylmalate synthase [Salinarimonas ramus]GGK44115.1 putative 2-isopropylmalate synthase [Salinarimonas ramus]
MNLSYPSGHIPRYDNFELVGLLDETMREGAERCPFSIPASRKAALTRRIVETGVRNVVFGSAPTDPDLMADILAELDRDGAAEGVELAFILLLNCWEPLLERFSRFPDAYKHQVCISFGMVDHKSEEKLFERACEKFRAIGFTKFRVSLLNNFSSGVDEKAYAHITRQIDRSLALGIDTVRINDSLGVCYPETMAVLAANLRHDYQNVHFCVHAHDDKGLGLQNALASIYHGFDLIEGGFSGFGNRSGLPAIEVLMKIFAEKNITIRGLALDDDAVRETGYAAEDTFLVVPNVYRPITGKIVNWENLGVANIPDYLGSERRARKFLTDVGTHDQTLRDVLRRADRPAPDETNALAPFRDALHAEMDEVYRAKRSAYESLIGSLEALYGDGILFEDVAVERAKALAM